MHTYLQNKALSYRLPHTPTLFAIRPLRELSWSCMPTLHPFLVGITLGYIQAGLSDWMFLDGMIGKLISKACSSSELRYQYRHFTKSNWFQSHCINGQCLLICGLISLSLNMTFFGSSKTQIHINHLLLLIIFFWVFCIFHEFYQ